MFARIRDWLAARRAHARRPAIVAARRVVWASLAARHGLELHPGRHADSSEGDVIQGHVDGRPLRIAWAANYDVQHWMITVSTACRAVTPNANLMPRDLVAWYAARATAVGAPAMDTELEPWVAGRQRGIGAIIRHDELAYRQLYDIDEATLELLIARLPRWARQLELLSGGSSTEAGQ